ncbi:hypothetical protein ACLK2G_10940 [Escherichia coli]
MISIDGYQLKTWNSDNRQHGETTAPTTLDRDAVLLKAAQAGLQLCQDIDRKSRTIVRGARMAAHNRSVGDGENWWGIYQHQVVVRAPPLQQFTTLPPQFMVPAGICL